MGPDCDLGPVVGTQGFEDAPAFPFISSFVPPFKTRHTDKQIVPRELSDHRQYQQLLTLSPGLEERLNTGTEGDMRYVADTVRRLPSSHSLVILKLKISCSDYQGNGLFKVR